MKNTSQNKTYRSAIAVATIWLLLIYLFIPYAPKFIDFLFKKFGFSNVKRALAYLTVGGAILAYIPFFKKFGLRKISPYIIAAVILSAACIINISLKIPAQTLHIPEYAILSIFLYRAFIIKYPSIKSYFLTALTGIAAGLIDERVIQFLLPARYYDIIDVLLNVSGTMVGILLIFVYRSK